MASGLLRVALNRFVLRRPVHIYGYYPPQKGADPNINMEFFESFTAPLPAIPRTIGFEGELKALKEKEKGPWKNLSQEERMDLYNLYFSMSMADMSRSTDEWKSVIGMLCVLVSFGMLLQIVFRQFILPPCAPSTLDPECMKASIKQQLQLHHGPVNGYASMWDYENNCWKK